MVTHVYKHPVLHWFDGKSVSFWYVPSLSNVSDYVAENMLSTANHGMYSCRKQRTCWFQKRSSRDGLCVWMFQFFLFIMSTVYSSPSCWYFSLCCLNSNTNWTSSDCVKVDRMVVLKLGLGQRILSVRVTCLDAGVWHQRFWSGAAGILRAKFHQNQTKDLYYELYGIYKNVFS